MKPIKEFSGKYRWLSNFWLTPIAFEGIVYPSVENAYQAAKTITNRSDFVNCSPGQAKRLGRTSELRQDWEEIKQPVMYKLLNQKFRQGSYLSSKLVITWKRDIIEGNTWGDTFWGVCNGVGENKLGEMLMGIREKLWELECQENLGF